MGRIIGEEEDMRLIAGLDYKDLAFGPKDNKNPIQSTPGIYMNIVHAPKFYQDLSKSRVTLDDSNAACSIGEYLQQCTRPWWHIGTSDDLYTTMTNHIKFEQSIKTNVITIQAIAQSPEIAPQIVEAAVTQLQAFMTTYKKKKAEQEYQYFLAQRQATGREYHKAQQDFARYTDYNNDINSLSVLSKKESLQKEIEIAYNRYDEAVRMCQRAQMKLKLSAPVFVYITKPYTPSSAYSPHYIANALIWLFFGWLFTWWWKLYQSKFRRHEPRQKVIAS